MAEPAPSTPPTRVYVLAALAIALAWGAYLPVVALNDLRPGVRDAIQALLFVATAAALAWGATTWLEARTRALLDELRGELLGAREDAMEEGFAVGYRAARAHSPRNVTAIKPRS